MYSQNEILAIVEKNTSYEYKYLEENIKQNKY